MPANGERVSSQGASDMKPSLTNEVDVVGINQLILVKAVRPDLLDIVPMQTRDLGAIWDGAQRR